MNLNIEKPWYRWKGQNPQQKSPLQEIHSSAKLHLYWGSHHMRLPSFRTEICQKDIADILGTRAFQRDMDTPLQTLDGIIMNQPKHFLPLAKEAKRIAKEIRIEKINEQWAGIP